MEDCRQVQQMKPIEIELQGPREQMHAVRGVHELPQRHAARTDAEALAEQVQVNIMPVPIGDHRERGEATFGSLGLADGRDSLCAREAQDFADHAITVRTRQVSERQAMIEWTVSL